METNQPAEKIFVAIGTDLNEGFSTLEWVLKKWTSRSIKVVILFSDNNVCRDYVYTPSKLASYLKNLILLFFSLVFFLSHFLGEVLNLLY